ncbi:unnamed protein product [Diabrotica balteata]|uniref:Uncharacterized protein n=1 Tax=Diabrotica balteata TaxID=107213 RepID=A0A9N9TFK0_DIABA|nr:unnamed protein product [Diabrotica balteata]
MLPITRGKRISLLAVGELNNSDENEPLNQIVDEITFQKEGTTKILNTDNIVVEINIDGNVGYNDQSNNSSGYPSVLLAIAEFPSREIFIHDQVQNCNIIEEINGSVTVELDSNENALDLLINTQEPAAIFEENVNEDSADKNQEKTYLNLSTFYSRENGDKEINSSVGDDSRDKDYIVPDTYGANTSSSDNEAENYYEKVAETEEMVEETELGKKILTKKDLEIQTIGRRMC